MPREATAEAQGCLECRPSRYLRPPGAKHAVPAQHRRYEHVAHRHLPRGLASRERTSAPSLALAACPSLPVSAVPTMPRSLMASSRRLVAQTGSDATTGSSRRTATGRPTQPTWPWSLSATVVHVQGDYARGSNHRPRHCPCSCVRADNVRVRAICARWTERDDGRDDGRHCSDLLTGL